MPFEITTADVWAGDVAETPGALADKLDILHRAGANLEFAIMRPSANVMSGRSLLFVAPLVGEQQTRAAREAGLASGLHALRLAGPDRPGIIADVSRALADEGIAVGGLWAAVQCGSCVLYFMLESGAVARRAAKLLADKLR